MFEKYSLEAQKAINLAESIAFNLDSSTISAEHLFLALLKNLDTPLAVELKKYNVGFKQFEKENKSIARVEADTPNNNFFMEYNYDLKCVFEQALSLCEKKNEEKISLLSLSLAVISPPTEIIAEFLKKTKVDSYILAKQLEGYYRRHCDLDLLSDLHRMGDTPKDPLIGRSKELNALIRAVKRRNKPNAILVGEPGVGKTHIVEEFARLLYNNQIEGLEDISVFEMDLASSVSGTKYRGEFEEKIKKIIKKVKENKHAILFIDEIHNIVKAGGAEGAIDCSNIIKPYLSRGEIRVIGATTSEEYENLFSMDKALKRRFQKVIVEDSSIEETKKILLRLLPIYENYYTITIDKDHVDLIVDLANKYALNEHFPDKAIDILDNSCVRGGKVLSAEGIRETVEEIYNVSVSFKPSSITTLEAISTKIFGQDIALKKLEKALYLMEKRRTRDSRPLSVLLFIGPSGCGKSETAKLLAKEYFKKDNTLIRLDMSQYDHSSLSRLIGSAPGYSGSSEITPFVKSLRSNPHSLILLDEIDKASPEILDFFMTTFDEGYFADSRGQKIDLTNCIIIMTSNFGYDNSTVFTKNINSTMQSSESSIKRKLEGKFRYEFLSRIDDIIIFESLKSDTLRTLALKEANNYSLQFENGELFDEMLAKKAPEIEKYGTRAIKKLVREELSNIIEIKQK